MGYNGKGSTDICNVGAVSSILTWSTYPDTSGHGVRADVRVIPVFRRYPDISGQQQVVL